VLKSPAFAKPQNVTSNPKRRHDKQKRTENDRQNANPSQNKKSCNPTHKPTQIAAHFILPNRTKAHPPPDFGTTDSLKGIFDRKAVLKLNFTNY
jgi:hypothetical protein